MCLTSLGFTSSDVATPACTTSQFQIGLVPDSDWTASLTYSQVVSLNGQGRMLPASNITFTAGNLGAYTSVPCAASTRTSHPVLYQRRD